MPNNNSFSRLTKSLRSLLGLLELNADARCQEAINLCDYLERETFRLAVFAPFNHGKSTLLNALLGSKTLPIDLIPTTGAAIKVGFGEELKTKIVLKNGREMIESGTKILQEYATLDGDRRMRDDVESVTVYANHPLLSSGVEFLDLPGTNDREEQNTLVKEQLSTANLIISVLDARKLMTLNEREHLRDWLENRGITTVVFVVNFLNLLEPEEQKQIQNRLRFVAESFRSQLPNNVSNLYRVDALPALRARLKGDMAAAQTTGLVTFETALQSIVAAQKEDVQLKRDRAKHTITEIISLAKEKQQQLTAELTTNQQKRQQQNEIKQKAAKLIRQGWQRSISELESWLYLPNLRSRFQSELTEALEQDKFTDWYVGEFGDKLDKYQQAITEWVEKGCEFFQRDKPQPLAIHFSQVPKIEIPEPSSNSQNNKNKQTKNDDPLSSVAIPGGVGFLFGGAVGAVVLGGASYVLNKMATQPDPQATPQQPISEVEPQVYSDAAELYLTQFSEAAFATLKDYQQQTLTLISFEPTQDNREITVLTYHLELLQSLIADIEESLRSTKDC